MACCSHIISEEFDDYNKHVTPIVNELYKLREIEHSKDTMKNKYILAKNKLKKVYKLLREYDNLVLDRPMWVELHDRMVYYYTYLNNTNLKNYDLPIFRETRHNDSVKWWVESFDKKLVSKTVAHFDTHEDMGLPEDPYQLLEKNGVMNKTKLKNGSCGLIYWPITCYLLSKCANNIVWCMPSWTYDNNLKSEQVLTLDKNDELYYIRYPSKKKDEFRLKEAVKIAKKGELDDLSKFKFAQKHTFNRLRTSTIKAWDKLATIIDNGFILDIDLDYFVCNGDKYSKKSYKKDWGDLQSTGRIHTNPGHLNPRALYEGKEGQTVIKQLKKEIKLVEKRIQIFLDGLKILKDNYNIKPGIINLSDSTKSLFSGNSTRAIFTNEYTPKYFVPILHYKLIEGFKKIYGNKLFC